MLIKGSTNEALKEELLQYGFQLTHAHKRSRSGSTVDSVVADVPCNALVGALEWLKYKKCKRERLGLQSMQITVEKEDVQVQGP